MHFKAHPQLKLIFNLNLQPETDQSYYLEFLSTAPIAPWYLTPN